MEAEEKAAKIGTEVIPWSLSEDDKKLAVPNPVGKSYLCRGSVFIVVCDFWFDLKSESNPA